MSGLEEDPTASRALGGVRICDLSGQLAGAGATRFLAAMGAEVIRIEDPVTDGLWDVLRGVPPFIDDRRGREFGGAFNNHNVEKLGVTLNLRTEAGKELFSELVATSDVVTENFAPGVMERLGFSYEELKEINDDIIYVSNFRLWPYRSRIAPSRRGVRSCRLSCGLAFSTSLSGRSTAGIGYSYMDHQGGNFMAIAILAGLLHRDRTGEGQWIDVSCTDAGALLNGPAMLDYTVNERPLRRPGSPDSNRSPSPLMAPHGIFPSSGDDNWVAIACRDDRDWEALAALLAEPWALHPRWRTVAGRSGAQDELERLLAGWTESRDRFDVASALRAIDVPASAVQRPA